MEACDDDAINPDHLDDIFVDRLLAPDVGVLTNLEVYMGEMSRVTILLAFRVDCEDDFYGDNCSVFCVAQNSNLNGFFTCDEEDGSRICLLDYYGESCNISCRDSSDPVNGFYTCDRNDGSRICTDGYTNPETFCTESE